MTPFAILTGDVREQLALLPDASIQCVVTSPPYWGLRDYGTGTWEGGDPTCKHKGKPKPRQDTSGSGIDKGRFGTTRGTQPAKRAYSIPVLKVCACGAARVDRQLGLEVTPDDYVAAMVDVFREVRRVLRDDGTLWLNVGDSYAGDAGGHSNHAGKRRVSPGHAIGGKTSAARLEGSGLGARLKSKNVVGIPWRLALALQDDGWYLRQDLIWAKPNPMPESVRDRCVKAHEYLFLLTKNERYYFDVHAIREASVGKRTPGKFPSGWATGSEPHDAVGFSAAVGRSKASGPKPDAPQEATRNPRSVWTIQLHPFKGAHFATFPLALVERCVKAGASSGGCCVTCGAPRTRVVEKGAPLEAQKRAAGADAAGGYQGHATKAFEAAGAQNASDVKRRILEGMRERITVGWKPSCRCAAGIDRCVVLDPFAGAATTGVAAQRLGHVFVGVELNPDYVAIARARMALEASACEVPLRDIFTDMLTAAHPSAESQVAV